MAIQLTKEETENCILVTLDYLQQNSDYPENGVALKKLAANMNMEVNEVKKFIKELKERNAVRWCFAGTIDGEFYIKTTPTDDRIF